MNYGIDKQVFDLKSYAENDETPRIGDQIAMSMGITNTHLHEAAYVNQHVKDLSKLSL